VVEAEPSQPGHVDAIDFTGLNKRIDVLVDDQRREHVTVATDGAAISLRVRSGTLLDGPVRLAYALVGLSRLDAQLQTLRNLLGLVGHDRLSPRRISTNHTVTRWVAQLRALDALETGASARDIANLLFGERRTMRDWRDASDYLRLRIQRLVRGARAMRDGGYLSLLL